jgi:hypothetical protein
MGGGFIGGDGSVRWEMVGDKVDSNYTSDPVGGHGRRQSAIDQTAAGAVFSVVIDKDAVPGGGGGQDYTFTLAIKPNQHKQIQVKWESALSVSPLSAAQKLLRKPPSPELIKATRELRRLRSKHRALLNQKQRKRR